MTSRARAPPADRGIRIHTTRLEEETMENTIEVCGVRISATAERRLTGLMRRADALSTAYTAVEDCSIKPAVRAETLEVLRQMDAEANREFAAYRRELGLE